MARERKHSFTTLAEFLTRANVRSMADSGSWSRAQAYVKDGSITNIVEFDNQITADAYGQFRYHVKLGMDDRGTFYYDCSCPAGEDIGFCKHCIATALLWIEQESKTRTSTKKKKKGTTVEDVRAYLLSLSKEELVEMAVERMRVDSPFRAQMMMQASVSSGDAVAELRKGLKEVTHGYDYVGYYESSAVAEMIEQVIHVMRDTLSGENALDMIELCEEGVAWICDLLDHADDSNGEIGDMLGFLQSIHLSACTLAKLEEVALAERLFNLEMEARWDTFYDADITYKRLIGKKGKQRYNELVVEAWDKLSIVTNDNQIYHDNRWHLEHLVRRIAAEKKDKTFLLSILQKNKHTVIGSLDLANFYYQKKEIAEGIRILEEAKEKHGSDWRIIETLITYYTEANEKEKALNFLWERFTARLSVEGYRTLVSQAKEWRVKTLWKEKAIEHVRALIVEKSKVGKNRSPYYRPLDGSLLVAIHTAENEYEKAWQVALEHGCEQSLWMELAEKRSAMYPDDTLIVWQEQLEELVDETNNASYREAYNLLLKVEKLMTKLGRKEEFREYLNELYTACKPKRNFIAMLKGKWNLN